MPHTHTVPTPSARLVHLPVRVPPQAAVEPTRFILQNYLDCGLHAPEGGISLHLAGQAGREAGREGVKVASASTWQNSQAGRQAGCRAAPQHQAVLYRCVTVVSWVSHRCVTVVLWVSHRCVTHVSWVSHRCVTVVLWVSHRCVTNVSWVCHGCVTDVSWVCHGYLMGVSHMCCRHVVGVSQLVSPPAAQCPHAGAEGGLLNEHFW